LRLKLNAVVDQVKFKTKPAAKKAPDTLKERRDRVEAPQRSSGLSLVKKGWSIVFMTYGITQLASSADRFIKE
jgi:hypothetical protein